MKGTDRTDAIDRTQDWGGMAPCPAHVGEITLHNISAVGKRQKSGKGALLGISLSIATVLGGAAEASIYPSTGRHAHEVIADYIRLKAEDLGLIEPQDPFEKLTQF